MIWWGVIPQGTSKVLTEKETQRRKIGRVKLTIAFANLMFGQKKEQDIEGLITGPQPRQGSPRELKYFFNAGGVEGIMWGERGGGGEDKGGKEKSWVRGSIIERGNSKLSEKTEKKLMEEGKKREGPIGGEKQMETERRQTEFDQT